MPFEKRHKINKKSLHQRFWEKVDKRNRNDCWEWQGSKTRSNDIIYYQ